MSNDRASRVFGWVAITVGICSFVLAIRGASNPVLYVTLMTWGGIFLVIGLVLLAADRIS
jgi:hypothetical protein